MSRNPATFPTALMVDQRTPDVPDSFDRAGMERCLLRLFECRAASDIAGMLACCAPDVVYRPHGVWSHHALSAPRRGLAELKQTLEAINVQYENLGTVIHEFLIDHELVALHRTVRLRSRGAGGVAEVGVCDFMRIRDGLVVEYAEYPDTVALAALEGNGV